MAGYDPNGGPGSGIGAVTMEAALSQYLDGGAHTFEILSNGGFTAVVVLKPKMTLSIGEVVFQFGNDLQQNQITLWRIMKVIIFGIS